MAMFCKVFRLALQCVVPAMAVTLAGLGAAGAQTAQPSSGKGDALPRPDKVVMVIEENRAFSRVIGSGAAPYLDSLAARGALLTQSFAVTHPSQPNYLALFSGSTQGVTDNTCPQRFTGVNLGSALIRAGYGFGIYSEGMPSVGYIGCAAGDYVRKHNPAVNWQGVNIPPEANMPFTSFPTGLLPDFSKLPTLSIVVPDQSNDMHDGVAPQTIVRGDAWLKTHLDAYVNWAMKNNSLLIVTFDEDDGSEANRIATVLVGPMVRPGRYAQRIDHYGLLRTLLDLYGLKPFGKAVDAAPLREVWRAVGKPAAPGSAPK